jgi:hypothetical protein
VTRNEEIRTRRQAGVQVKILAVDYGLSQCTISRIAKGCKPESRRQKQKSRKNERVNAASELLSREIQAARNEAAMAPLYQMPDAEIERYLNRDRHG